MALPVYCLFAATKRSRWCCCNCAPHGHTAAERGRYLAARSIATRIRLPPRAAKLPKKRALAWTTLKYEMYLAMTTAHGVTTPLLLIRKAMPGLSLIHI